MSNSGITISPWLRFAIIVAVCAIIILGVYLMFERPWWHYAIGAAGVGAAAIGAKKVLLPAANSQLPPAPPVPPPAVPANTTPSVTPNSAATALTNYLSDAFFRGVLDLEQHFQSKGAKITGDDLLEIFIAESDCNPKAINKTSSCAGLNQICNLSAVGFTGAAQAYIALTGEQQLPFVQKYFDNTNRYPQILDVGSLYLTNFSPAFLGQPQNFVMYRKTDAKNPKTGLNTYDQNASVDTGGKGFIEVADMAKFVHRSSAGRAAKFAELKARLVAQRGNV